MALDPLGAPVLSLYSETRLQADFSCKSKGFKIFKEYRKVGSETVLVGGGVVTLEPTTRGNHLGFLYDLSV